MSDILPSNYFSWREICEFEKLNVERVGQSVKRMNEIMSSLTATMSFPSAKASAAYYNNGANQLNVDRRYNQLLYHSKLEKIAPLFKWFIKDRVSRDGGNKYQVADLGILKTHYLKYRQTGEAPNIKNRGAAKTNYTPAADNGRTKIDLPKTPVYQQFAATVKAANKASKDKVTIPQMILICIEYYMKQFPDLFGTTEIQVAPDTEIRVKDNDTLHIQVSPETTKKLSALLARYNSANILPMTQSKLVEKAILQMIERVPVELSDPELARELREINEQN